MTATAELQRGAAEGARRMTLSQIVELLLTRGSHAGSSVTLARNSKGDTQMEVIVRTDPDAGIASPADAAAVCQTVYDQLRSAYPMASGYTGGQT